LQHPELRLVEDAAIDAGKPRYVDTFREAKAHEQIFVRRFRGGQGFILLEPMTRHRHRIDPCLGRLEGGERSLHAGDRDAAMGAGPRARVVATPPIQEVVARLRTPPRMVGDLVGRKPGRLAQCLRLVIQRARDRAIRNAQSSGRMTRGEGRARLNSELVEREVAFRVVQRAGKLLAPGLHALPLPPIDEACAPAL